MEKIKYYIGRFVNDVKELLRSEKKVKSIDLFNC